MESKNLCRVKGIAERVRERTEGAGLGKNSGISRKRMIYKV